MGSSQADLPQVKYIAEINSLIAEIEQKVEAMTAARAEANKIEDDYTKALAYSKIADRIADLRTPIDKLEEIVDNDLWPLPKYRELLFIN